MSSAVAAFHLGNLYRSQEFCWHPSPPRQRNHFLHLLDERLWCLRQGPSKHYALWVLWNGVTGPMQSTQLLIHIWTLSQTFSLSTFFGGPEAGERDLLLIYLEHLIGRLWEGHCLLRQNNHGTSRQDGKRKKKRFIISRIIFAFGLWDGWRLLTVCERESKA